MMLANYNMLREIPNVRIVRDNNYNGFNLCISAPYHTVIKAMSHTCTTMHTYNIIQDFTGCIYYNELAF